MEHEVAVIAIPLWSVFPFVCILLSIAFFPLFAPTLWHHHYPKIAAFFGIPTAFYISILNWHWLAHTFVEYVSFMVLLGSLFVIAGGIFIRGNLVGHPAVNGLIFVVGAVASSFIGTTGASMILIRPLLRANSERPYRHVPVVFFIFVVSNMGGLLTPLGDPPLFLGFLKGVPFFWTFSLFPQWLLGNAMVILIYLVLDSYLLKKNNYQFRSRSHFNTFGIDGSLNLVFLLGVLGTVIAYGQLPVELGIVRECIQVIGMGVFTGLSIRFSKKAVRDANNFTLAPIKEVGILFAAIFTCMIPALKLLEFEGADLGITTPRQFFWYTGLLSSFLDNAPTYLAFLSLGKTLPEVLPMVMLAGEGQISDIILKSVSLGAVFMGAMTYIGNGPNFMVKAIAEENQVSMPSFLGYVKFSVLILLPVFLLISYLFL
jgi:Na+/H+ antiporter NhaD/arsenite permease-like protein